MTQSSARETRIQVISEGVVASYIHDISTRTSLRAPAAAGRAQVAARTAREPARVRGHHARARDRRGRPARPLATGIEV